jgi:DNA-binding NtrC family response regulator
MRNLSYKERLNRWERDLFVQAMFRTAGNQTAAARLLRIPIRTFTYKLKNHGLLDRVWVASQQREN